MIPYGRQDITQSDIDAVVEVLKSNWLTQGPGVGQFEQAVSSYCGAKYGVAVNSATSALHIACLALGLGPGDLLWTTPNTFVASANCGLYCGANVDFVDIDPRTYNLSEEALRIKLEKAEISGKLPSIVVPVHFAGQSCDMRAIRNLADRYGFKILEDASHAIGGRYLNEPIGNCTYSDITVFSFHPVKIITTGEGGVAVTNSSELAERMARLRTHGITRETGLMKGESEGPWYYQQIELGYNYRITDIQAALGLSQMERLDDYVSKRHELAKRYDERLAELPLLLPYRRDNTYSAFHLYVVQIDNLNTLVDRLSLFQRLREAGIGVNVHYIPVHTQPYYRELGFRPGDFPASEQYYSNAISLPLFPTMTQDQQKRIITVLEEILR